MRPEAPLAAQLDWLPPRVEDVKDEQVLERFLAYVEGKGLTLYAAQEEAILELYAGKNVILATPTGSGKSLVATALAFLAVARGLRLYYTCPIKALVSEKFFALCEELGPEWVGMVTGDASVNHDAPILCCTAEILSNLALREGAAADVDLVVMDEFHYYADPDRGVAWQIPLLELRRAGFLLLSATLGPTARFEEALREVTGRETVTVRGMHRPVPLEFEYRETPLHETIADLVKKGRAPIYLVSFSQRAAAEQAQNLLSVDHATKDEKQAIHAALVGVRFDSPYGKELSRLLRHGVGLHHAGLLPKYRRVVERLAQKGLLRVVSGTDTLGVGVNVPIRTVLLTQLCKYDGQKTALLTVRDFHQLAGRAGRRGFDESGTVVAQAPEHVIENLRIDSKIAADPAKRKKLVKRKPPDRGYVHWDRATFERLVTGEPEPLESRFAVSHGMILSVLARPGGGCLALGRLIRRSHERRARQRIHGRRALELLGSLRTAGILSNEGGRLVLHAELPEDFSLHQALSLYLVHAVDALAGASEAYALDLLSAVESILENPTFVLQRQLDAVKTRTLAELKAAGVPYEERLEALEKLEYPMPNRDFAYDTFNEFAKLHPWVKEHAVRPKSIARELVETYQSFPEYVREYGLERGEGVLLRYLSEVWRTLAQTIPPRARTPEVEDVETYLRAIVRAVDSSLVDEWEALRTGAPPAPPAEEAAPPGEADVTERPRELLVLIRNAVFQVVRALARRDFAGAAQLLEAGEFPAEALGARFAEYFGEHAELLTGPSARATANTRVLSREDRVWRVEQVLVDPAGANDWALRFRIDLDRTRELGRPALELVEILS